VYQVITLGEPELIAMVHEVMSQAVSQTPSSPRERYIIPYSHKVPEQNIPPPQWQGDYHHLQPFPLSNEIRVVGGKHLPDSPCCRFAGHFFILSPPEVQNTALELSQCLPSSCEYESQERERELVLWNL
jgi:hypothetical protein